MSFDLHHVHHHNDYLKDISLFVFLILVFLVVLKTVQVLRMYKNFKKTGNLSYKKELPDSFSVLIAKQNSWLVEVVTTRRVSLLSITCYLGLFYEYGFSFSFKYLFWFYSIIPVLFVIGLAYFSDKLYRRVEE